VPPDENALGLLLCSATLPDDGDLAILKTSMPFLVGAMYSSGSNPPPPTLLGVDLDLLDDDEVDLFRGSLREIRGGFVGAIGGVFLFFCIRCGCGGSSFESPSGVRGQSTSNRLLIFCCLDEAVFFHQLCILSQSLIFLFREQR
jgi:hypothetical protein